MQNRIDVFFAETKNTGKKAFVPYITAGDPNLATSLELMNTLVAKGAGIIELGVPFSDPIADGPVIQKAIERSLNKKTSIIKILHLVQDFRSQNKTTPIILMSYLNPLLAYGYEKFIKEAVQVGVDGLLIIDMPIEETKELLDIITKLKYKDKIKLIFIVAPTTNQKRIEQISEYASGFIYFVSLKGVTGASNFNLSTIEEKISHLKKTCNLPVCIGFGIKTKADIKAVSKLADGFIIGSAIVAQIGNSVTNFVDETIQTNVVVEVERMLNKLIEL